MRKIPSLSVKRSVQDERIFSEYFFRCTNPSNVNRTQIETIRTKKRQQKTLRIFPFSGRFTFVGSLDDLATKLYASLYVTKKPLPGTVCASKNEKRSTTLLFGISSFCLEHIFSVSFGSIEIFFSVVCSMNSIKHGKMQFEGT